MLPIDDDILQSRYGDDSMAAEWYRNWRSLGAKPDEAIRAVDNLCRLRDKLFPHLTQAQFHALERYADACARSLSVFTGIEQLQDLAAYRPPSESECVAFIEIVRHNFSQADTPLTPDAIKRLADEAQQVAALIREQLSH